MQEQQESKAIPFWQLLDRTAAVHPLPPTCGNPNKAVPVWLGDLHPQLAQPIPDQTRASFFLCRPGTSYFPVI